VTRRATAVAALAEWAGSTHRELTAGREDLWLGYKPSFGPDHGTPPDADAAAIGAGYLSRLQHTRGREVAAGVTLIGPHRDDLQFRVLDHDLQDFGSRGQQRTASMALKLAEVELMRAETGECPLLLLDDAMSELDERRRGYLARRLETAEQAIITTTDLSDFAPDFLAEATVWRVVGGRLEAR
jgi:DNA replication and repair protein RecF